MEGIELLSEESTVCADTSPTFRAYLGNLGSQHTSDFTIRWIVDETAAFDGGHAGVAPGATHAYDHIWYDMTEGPHELRFIVDVNDQVEEIDEANNQGVMTFTAVPCIG